MSQTAFIRDTVLKHLRDNQYFDGMLAAEINGCNFSAVDIALPDTDNHCKVFRLVIIKQADNKIILNKAEH